jgi:sulfonate transport system permease protein
MSTFELRGRLAAGRGRAAPEGAAPSQSRARPAGAFGGLRRLSALKGWLLPAAILLLWEAASRLALVSPQLLPTPGAVVGEIVGLAQTGELADHVAVTAGRVFAGFLWGTLAATLLGTLTGASATARGLLDPTIQALKAVPSLAWVPLFILWFGIFETSKVALIAVGVFFPVYLNLMAGIRQTDRKLVEVARVYGLNRWQIARRVLVPATLPSYFVGLRGGLALGWMFVIAAELMGASEGLGFLMVDGQMTGRPALIVASLILFALVGKASDALLAGAGHRLLTWQDSLENREEAGHA